MPGRLGVFVGISVLLALTPGPDFALVTRNSLAWGRRGALATCAGLTSALSVWVLATALGIAPLLERSAIVGNTLRIAGATYLVYLGTRTLWASRRDPPPLPGPADGAHAPATTGQPATGLAASSPGSTRLRATRPPASDPPAAVIWRQGFLSALLNPKLGVFFVTFLPQFVSPGHPALPQLLFLGGLFTVIGIAWMVVYGLSVSRLRDVVGSVRVRRWLERATGTALLGFGARLAVERI